MSQRPGGGEGPAAEVRKAAAQQARDTPPASPTPDPPILAPPVEQPATPTPTPAPDQVNVEFLAAFSWRCHRSNDAIADPARMVAGQMVQLRSSPS